MVIYTSGLRSVPDRFRRSYLYTVFTAGLSVSLSGLRAAGGGFRSCKAVFGVLQELVRICVLGAVALFTIHFRLIYGLCTHI